MNAVNLLAALVALFLIAEVLVDCFETVILPRRVSRPLRFSRWYYLLSWRTVRWLGRRLGSANRREAMLGVFGPLSLIVLFLVWSATLVLGFGLLYWALGSHLATAQHLSFGTDLYYSGTTFFTLGLGDVVPLGGKMRLLTVVEAATGFGFLALVISYLPVLYQAFARREQAISLLDSRAGSPPAAAELLIRASQTGGEEAMHELLVDWERWAADLMESHLSYPVLAFFRSHHERQSWVGAVTAVLDTCALIRALDRGSNLYQANLTFAIARHVAVDLSQVFRVLLPPKLYREVSQEQLAQFVLTCAGPELDPRAVRLRLDDRRLLYERYIGALGEFLELPLPPFFKEEGVIDDWESVASEV